VVICPGCGTVRAVSCALHGDLFGALDHNHMVVVVLPLLVWIWVRGVVGEFAKKKRNFK